MSPRHVVRAYIGLGANVGDAQATLTRAVAALDGLSGVRVRAVSRLYATRPVGVTDQREFLNAVVLLDVRAGADPASGADPTSDALSLLARLKTLEREAGRRTRERWGPRELDLDLLVFGRARLDIERPLDGRSVEADRDPAKASRHLVVPHPEASQRLFVLAPLADLAAGLVPPGWAVTVATARRRQLAREGEDAVRVVGAWDLVARSWRPV